MKLFLLSRINKLSLPIASLALLSIATVAHVASFFDQSNQISQILVDEATLVTSAEITRKQTDIGTLERLLSVAPFGEKHDQLILPVAKTHLSNLPELPVKLLGIIASNSQRSAALLEINGAREVYVAGDKLGLDEDVIVKEIFSDHLILDRLGILQQLKMPKKETLLEQGLFPTGSPRQRGTSMANTMNQ